VDRVTLLGRASDGILWNACDHLAYRTFQNSRGETNVRWRVRGCCLSGSGEKERDFIQAQMGTECGELIYPCVRGLRRAANRANGEIVKWQTEKRLRRKGANKECKVTEIKRKMIAGCGC
jgi:hypothetical protein